MNINNKSFTMAEILISLTIIGILAAIILPTLNIKLNEKALKTQRKALYARLSQVIGMMDGLSDYGDYVVQVEENGEVTTEGVDNAAESFITEGLGKNLKFNQVCAAKYGASDDEIRAELKKCGISEQYTNALNTKSAFPLKFTEAMDNVTNAPATNVAAFSTVNGESVAVFYNPTCTDRIVLIRNSGANYYDNARNNLCAVFVFDLNGLKGTNKMNSDMGIFTLTNIWKKELNYIAPLLPSAIETYGTYSQMSGKCVAKNPSLKLPSLSELYGMIATIKLYFGERSTTTTSVINNVKSSWVFSSTPLSVPNIFGIESTQYHWSMTSTGSISSYRNFGAAADTDGYPIWCNRDILK